MSKRYPGLVPRGGVWIIRKRVPKALQAALNKQEIWKSLHTSDRKQAEIDYLTVKAEIEGELERARQSLGAEKPRVLTSAMAEVFVLQWFRMKWQLALDQILNTLERLDVDGLIQELKEDERHLLNSHETQLLSSLQKTADDILVEKGFSCAATERRMSRMRKRRLSVSVDKGSEGYWDLISLVKRAELELIRRQRNVLRGGEYSKCFDPQFQSFVSQANEGGAGRSSLTIGEAIEQYLERNTDFSARAIIDRRAAFRPMLEIVGDHLPVVELNRDHLYETFDLIRKLPPNATKGRDFGSNSLQEIAQLAEEADESTLSATSVNKYMSRISGLMRYLVDGDLIQKNWANGDLMRAKKRVRGSDEDTRDPFGDDQLIKLFADEKFSKPLRREPSFYWAPIIALYHGMRMEEILQLTELDVLTDRGITYFKIHGKGTNHVKNDQSKRDVPIHSKMWEYGFAQLIDDAKVRSDGRLFWDVPRGESSKKFSSVFSQRFSRYLLNIGVKTPSTSFHSLRHNFRDACRNCSIPDDRACAIGGWTFGQGQHTQYGAGISLAEKAKAIEQLHFPDLELGSIARWDA